MSRPERVKLPPSRPRNALESERAVPARFVDELPRRSRVNEPERSRLESENLTSRLLRTFALLERSLEPDVMLRERSLVERESNRAASFDRLDERPDEMIEREGDSPSDRELPADDRSDPLREILPRLLSDERDGAENDRSDVLGPRETEEPPRDEPRSKDELPRDGALKLLADEPPLRFPPLLRPALELPPPPELLPALEPPPELRPPPELLPPPPPPELLPPPPPPPRPPR